MKTIHFLSATLLAAVCFANPLNNHLNAQTSMASKAMAAKQYACPHHPDKVSGKPGKCACGMDLAEVKAPAKMDGKAKPMMEKDSKAMKTNKSKSKKMKGKMDKKSSKPMKAKDEMMAKPSTDMKKESDMQQKM